MLWTPDCENTKFCDFDAVWFRWTPDCWNLIISESDKTNLIDSRLWKYQFLGFRQFDSNGLPIVTIQKFWNPTKSILWTPNFENTKFWEIDADMLMQSDDFWLLILLIPNLWFHWNKEGRGLFQGRKTSWKPCYRASAPWIRQGCIRFDHVIFQAIRAHQHM